MNRGQEEEERYTVILYLILVSHSSLFRWPVITHKKIPDIYHCKMFLKLTVLLYNQMHVFEYFKGIKKGDGNILNN